MRRKSVALQIRPRSVQIYKEASEALLRRTGVEATPEEIMAWVVDTDDDPEDIIDRYCVHILKLPWEDIRKHVDEREEMAERKREERKAKKASKP